MATKYDPIIIQKLADKLYSKARTVVVLWMLMLMLCGTGSGYGAGATMHQHDLNISPEPFAVVGFFLGAVLGYVIGQARAFQLRVMAQTVLCQKQIEENTRFLRRG